MADVLNQPSRHVIVSSAYGCLDVYPATREVAMKIFEENRQYLMPEAVQLAELGPGSCACGVGHPGGGSHP